MCKSALSVFVSSAVYVCVLLKISLFLLKEILQNIFKMLLIYHLLTAKSFLLAAYLAKS